MEAFLHQVLSGLATGGIYASLALALVMIYQSTNHINFAQGEMAMFSTYLAWSMINAGLPYWWAFLLTVAISFVAGVVIERVIIRPVENAPVLSVVTVFVALLVIFNSIAGWIYTYTIKTFPSPFPEQPLFGNRYISSHELGAIGDHADGAAAAVRVLPLHPARAGHARGRAEPDVEPAGRHSRGLDARAGLGTRGGGRARSPACWSHRSSISSPT